MKEETKGKIAYIVIFVIVQILIIAPYIIMGLLSE